MSNIERFKSELHNRGLSEAEIAKTLDAFFPIWGRLRDMDLNDPAYFASDAEVLDQWGDPLTPPLEL